MGKKKASITCPTCHTVAWRSWGQFGGPGAKGECGKGNGKKGKEAPAAAGSADATPSSRPKASAGFKFATPAITDPLSEPLKNILKGIEGLEDREAILTAAERLPGLAEAVTSLLELRWPATTPDKEAQRDLARAQQEERTAEKAFGDAQATTAKARTTLAEAEAAEAVSLAAHEAAVAKSAEASARYSSLKNKGVLPGADAAMTPGDGTVAIEADLGRVRRLVAAKEEVSKSYAQQRDLAVAKGMGKGKGTDARAASEPYVAGSTESGVGASDLPAKDLQLMVDDSSKTAALMKEALASMEAFQKQYNEMLAKVNSLAGADSEL